ncbi:MAG: hypothetical protein NTX64_09950 [Elusimicrobia bacterium]|nr:hypothetical protein [Elusimicrobiota bacterium]
MKTTDLAFIVGAALALLLPIEARSACPGAYDCNGNGSECAPTKDCCSKNAAAAAAKCKAMGVTCDSCSGANDWKDALNNKLQKNDSESLGDSAAQDRKGFTVENDNDSRGNPSGDGSHQGGTASNLHSNEVNGVVIDPRNSNGVHLGDYGVVTDNATGEQYPVVAYDTHPGRGNSISEISNGLQNAMTGVDNSNSSVNGNYTVQMYPGSGQTFNNGQDVRTLGGKAR